MEADLIAQFKEFLPRLLIYIVVPFYLGMQLTMLAKEERSAHPNNPAGSYALDVIGLIFAVGVSAFIVVSSIFILKMGQRYPEVMAGIFRYGLMFLFYGMWWQFFVIMALKAYRDREKGAGKMRHLLFYAVGSVFISLLAFINSEWFLKYMSLAFLAMAVPLFLLSFRRMVIAFLAAAAVAFAAQTAGFIYVSSLV